MKLRWLSTVAQILGATLLAARIGPPAFAYVVMTMGALGWIKLARSAHDGPLLALNVGFLALNCVGVVRWLAG